jgi:hypothetical protein
MNQRFCAMQRHDWLKAVDGDFNGGRFISPTGVLYTAPVYAGMNSMVRVEVVS